MTQTFFLRHKKIMSVNIKIHHVRICIFGELNIKTIIFTRAETSMVEV